MGVGNLSAEIKNQKSKTRWLTPWSIQAAVELDTFSSRTDGIIKFKADVREYVELTDGVN